MSRVEFASVVLSSVTDIDVDNVIAVGIECYQLESVCRLRKYLSFTELGLSFLTSRIIFISGWSRLLKAQVPICLRSPMHCRSLLS